MFSKFPNHQESNYLIEILKNSYSFDSFEEQNKTDRSMNVLKTIYTAKTSDRLLTLEITFPSKTKTKNIEKNYQAHIAIIQNKPCIQNPSMKRQDRLDFSKILENLYSPSFDQFTMLIDLFIEEGQKAGIIEVFDKKYVEKSLMSYLSSNMYSSKISLRDNNIGDVYFNNILQKGVGYNNRHFKKSYINVDILYLVHSDLTMHPYFKIRLPYSDNKKISYVMPLGKSNKVYMFKNDKKLTTQHIDTQKPFDLVESDIRSYFKKTFKDEVVKKLSNQLKLNKSDLAKLSQDQLKEYFVIAEMVKL